MNIEPTDLSTLVDPTEHINLHAALSQMNFAQGKVLTIIDASTDDQAKRKALKDLIKASFRDQMKWMTQFSRGEVCGSAPSVERERSLFGCGTKAV